MLSARFVAAISTAGQSNALKSFSWKASAEFVYRMNKVIDAMNVYYLNNWKGEKDPLSDDNTMVEELFILSLNGIRSGVFPPTRSRDLRALME